MPEIIIGERVINKKKEYGTILSFDGQFLVVDFQGRVAHFQADAFEKGFLSYENTDLQSSLEKASAAAQQEAEKRRLVAEKAANDRKTIQSELSKAHFNIAVLSASIRLAPAPLKLNSVRRTDQALIRNIFTECDQSIEALYATVQPKMTYLRNSSYVRSKYCVGFLCKHFDTYVFRVFSRNDEYTRSSNNGITVTHSDTTEVLRVIWVNAKTYYFSKNLASGGECLVNTKAHGSWHISKLTGTLQLNSVLQACDCGYLNDSIAQTNVDCFQYLKLLIPAFTNNKMEIVFKHKLFSAADRIEDVVTYLEAFSSKQIDFACKNNALNVLPIIKRHGNLELPVLQRLEHICRRNRSSNSIYTALEGHLTHLGLDCPDLDKKLIGFLKKVDNFYAPIYNDYINLLAHRQGITLKDFFDKDYVDRHRAMIREKHVYYTAKEQQQYSQIARELSWIDREENDYFIMIPKSIEEFMYEGELQHNCVYTNEYFLYVIYRQSIIVFLRKEKHKPYVTIEFDYETFEVLQAFGKFNTPIDDALYDFIVSLGKQLKYEMHSQG